VRRNTVVIDIVIAAILTILIVVLSPGLAVVGLIALLVVLVCAISFAFDRWRRSKRPSRREPALRTSRPRSSGRSPRRS
jgi:ABC-type bacteriocin/lantibiotic exporter with double-glycine peptidase domain